MQDNSKTVEQVEAEVEELRRQLGEAREALEAIRRGDVDAVVVDRPEGPKVYTLTGADTPYRVMVEEMQEGAVTLSNDGVILYCNKQIARMLDTSHQHLLGRPFRDFLAPTSLPRFEAFWQRSRTEASRGEVRLVAANGGQVPVYLALRLLPADGLTQTSVVIADLTEQKRYQDIMASEVFATSVLDQAQDAIVVCDPSGQVIRANRAAERLSAVNTILQPFDVAFPLRRDNHDAALSLLPLASAAPFVRGIEAFLIQPNGFRVELLLSTAQMLDFERKLLGTVVTMTDITARKQAEDALRRSESALRAFFDSPGMLRGIVEVVAGDIRFVSANKATAAAYGLTPDAVCGKLMSDLGTPPDLTREYMDRCEESRRTERAISFEMLRPFEDGDRWLLVTVSYLGTGTAGCPRFAFVALDITERRQAEEDLRKSTEELARSNRSLEQFAIVVSHDLQEPLRTVTGFVQLLQKKYANQPDADASTWIEFTLGGARRMEALIKDLLAYARVGTRGQQPVLIDAGAVLGQALENLHESIQETGAEITHSELPAVQADPSQLAQLFQNLLGNAMKFRGEAPPKVHVDARREGKAWRFSVSDNGIGIDPKFQDQIFEVFRRLHNRQQYEGTGIGLAICKKIVDRHGGRIWVESQPGQGATFSFTLPTR